MNNGVAPSFAGLIYLGTNFHQMTNNVKMAFLCCNEQWCFENVRVLIYLGTNFHQMMNNVNMAFPCCKEQ